MRLLRLPWRILPGFSGAQWERWAFVSHRFAAPSLEELHALTAWFSMDRPLPR